jgi:uncharacterized protein (DUF362 family)/Pyruvate/2-oxoacid:ferredoxin oxidoreductase delta subunit
MSHDVAVIRCGSYEPDEIEQAVRRGIGLLGGIERFVRPGERIVLKPNVLYGSDPKRCVVTHPAVFRAVARLCVEHDIQASYGDSPAVRNPSSNLKRAGFTAVADELGLACADFSTPVAVDYPEGRITRRLVLSRGVLDADGVISVAKCKTHGLTRFTGAMKNLYGCIPGAAKGQYHAQYPDAHDLCRFLVDLCGFIRPRLSIIDAVMAMEGNGPGSGTPRFVGALVMSADPVAADAVACRIIDLPATCVPTLVHGQEAGLGTWQMDRINLLGDPVEPLVLTDFDVVRRPPIHTSGSGLRRAIKDLTVVRPVIDRARCIRCGRCIEVCPVDPKAVDWGPEGKSAPPRYRYARCIRCFCCNEVCPARAIRIHEPFLARFAPVLSFIALLMSQIRHRMDRNR